MKKLFDEIRTYTQNLNVNSINSIKSLEEHIKGVSNIIANNDYRMNNKPILYERIVEGNERRWHKVYDEFTDSKIYGIMKRSERNQVYKITRRELLKSMIADIDDMERKLYYDAPALF